MIQSVLVTAYLPPKYAIVDGDSSVVIDELQDIQTGESGRVLHRTTLSLVEVSRHSDNTLGNRLS